jgi:hypothetical protein
MPMPDIGPPTNQTSNGSLSFVCLAMAKATVWDRVARPMIAFGLGKRTYEITDYESALGFTLRS